MRRLSEGRRDVGLLNGQTAGNGWTLRAVKRNSAPVSSTLSHAVVPVVCLPSRLSGRRLGAIHRQ